MKKAKKPKLTISLGSHPEYPHRLAKTAKEHAANLELLFQLQLMDYPELRKGIRMNRKRVRVVKR